MNAINNEEGFIKKDENVSSFIVKNLIEIEKSVYWVSKRAWEWESSRILIILKMRAELLIIP